MKTASRASTSAWLAGCVCAAALAFTACNEANPTGPDPVQAPPVATPPPSPTPGPGSPTGSIQIGINPNPVQQSGQPITDAPGCANVRYTWFYEQVIQETGGSQVTLTNRIDLFDERETNNTNINVVVPANGSVTIRSRWCSSSPGPHSSQTRWSGTDAGGRSITLMGPRVDLMRP